MSRLQNFMFKLKRGFSWFVFSFQQNPWQEDEELFQTIEKVLLDTATYFEKREQNAQVVAVSNKEDVADMRLAAKLIRMKLNGHYSNTYIESQVSPNYVTSDSKDLFDERDWKTIFKPSYNPGEASMTEQKDTKALKLAMHIIAEKGLQWWI